MYKAKSVNIHHEGKREGVSQGTKGFHPPKATSVLLLDKSREKEREIYSANRYCETSYASHYTAAGCLLPDAEYLGRVGDEAGNVGYMGRR